MSLDATVTVDMEAEPFDEITEKSADEINNSLIVTFDQVTLSGVEFLWQDFIPAGEVIFIHGEGGSGKSTIILRFMLDLTMGSIPGKYYGLPQNVAIMVPEGDLEKSLKPRVQFSNVTDQSKVQAWKKWYDPRIRAVSKKMLTLKSEEEIEEVRRRIVNSNIKFLLIDSRYRGMNLGNGSNDDVFKAFDRLIEVAHETDCTIAVIGHDNKAKQTDSKGKMGGVAAWYDAPRAAYHIIKTDSGEGVFALAKANDFNDETPAKCYLLESKDYTVEGVVDKDGVPVIFTTAIGHWNGQTEQTGKEFVSQHMRELNAKHDSDLKGGSANQKMNLKEWVLSKLIEAGDSGLTVNRIVEMAAAEGLDYSSGSISNLKTRALKSFVDDRKEEQDEKKKGGQVKVWFLNDEGKSYARKMLAKFDALPLSPLARAVMDDGFPRIA